LLHDLNNPHVSFSEPAHHSSVHKSGEFGQPSSVMRSLGFAFLCFYLEVRAMLKVLAG
jgi:hypothetical protein